MNDITDRRLNRRSIADLNQNKGAIEVEINGKTFPVLGSKNISISGMDIQAQQAAIPAADVRLLFKTPDLALTVKGQVAWCATPAFQQQTQHTPPSDAFSMGIEFDPSTMKENSLLFLALRQYVDKFE